ncbi:hypothetical protein HHK36_027334 [Tetracentron sinense]|uniref:Uncharacterized protein n=1 Tax=Tetracentron sinense TaxID=13715 RepID=A0A834YHQ4_TETSI|nr:hypothetical protein HHK36_027334 [Tetracentron sinense]
MILKQVSSLAGCDCSQCTYYICDPCSTGLQTNMGSVSILTSYWNPSLQLLVNRTLYEKTLASGFGSVHFLLDASEQQQYKEAILAYALLLQAEKGQVTSRKSVGNTCERFMYDKFNEKVEMPVDKAIDTLLRLGLVTEVSFDGNVRLHTIPCPKAYETLKQRWNNFLG